MLSPGTVPILPYFQQFFLQAIKNNPRVLYNRYYVGNGGLPIYEMMTSYLTTFSINGSHYARYQEIQQVLYNIVKYSIQNNYVDVRNNKQREVGILIYSLRLSSFITTKTVECVYLLLDIVQKKILQCEQEQQKYE